MPIILRSVALLSCLILCGAFASGDPILGKWSTCGWVKIGDPRIELQKKNLVPCSDHGNTWTDLRFDTVGSGRVTICVSSCGSLPPGVPCLTASGTCYDRNWSYDKSTSTLMIKDSTTVYYLVSSITDSLMVLIKK